MSDNKGEAGLGKNCSEADLCENERNLLFQQALNYEKENDLISAQKCYLKSIDGLKKGSAFSLLPLCLRNLADIYYKQGDYDKAVNFVKAEKLFYESRLIETTGAVGARNITVDAEDVVTNDSRTASLVQADQYEHLARLCLDQLQLSLALEYSGKAAALRQSTLGDSHPVTQASLNFLATIYAQLGREQYSQSIEELSKNPLTDSGLDTTANNSAHTHSPQLPAPDMTHEDCTDNLNHTSPLVDAVNSQQSILRQRNSPQEDARRQSQHVRFTEPRHGRRGRDDRSSHLLLWAGLSLCLLLLALLLHCRREHSCPMVRVYLSSLHNHAQYYYHYYSSTHRATV